jgi:hypothetical protein
MKGKKQLSNKQIEQLKKAEKEQLTLKYTQDLADLETKYESLKIEINIADQQPVKPAKIKLTNDLLIKMYTEGKTIIAIREETGYTIHYIYSMIRKLIEEGKLEERKHVI